MNSLEEAKAVGMKRNNDSSDMTEIIIVKTDAITTF